MAIYVYVTATGQLYSYCPNDTDPVAPADVLAANGLTAISGQLPLDSTHQWNAGTHSVQVVAAPPATNFINTSVFVFCFTSAELATIRASSDPLVQRFFFALPTQATINTLGAFTQQALAQMTTLNLLAAGRQAQITAGTVQVT